MGGDPPMPLAGLEHPLVMLAGLAAACLRTSPAQPCIPEEMESPMHDMNVAKPGVTWEKQAKT